MSADDRLLELRKVAQQADDSGRAWFQSLARGDRGYPQAIHREGDAALVAQCFESDRYPSVFADHIVAFDPPTVLRLLDELLMLRAGEAPELHATEGGEG